MNIQLIILGHLSVNFDLGDEPLKRKIMALRWITVSNILLPLPFPVAPIYPISLLRGGSWFWSNLNLCGFWSGTGMYKLSAEGFLPNSGQTSSVVFLLKTCQMWLVFEVTRITPCIMCAHVYVYIFLWKRKSDRSKRWLCGCEEREIYSIAWN